MIRIAPVLIALTVMLSAASCLAAPTKTAGPVWDVGLLELFDASNTSYTIASGRVCVDLDAKSGLCPTGLGQLASGRENVREIELRYTAFKPGKCWLHIVWNPGGSGNEQLEVSWNGKVVGKSKLIDGSKRPEFAEHEVFQIQSVKGANTLVIKHLCGDGLNLQRITLADTADTARLPHTLNPRLKFPTLAVYEREIGEPGVLYEKDHIRVYAPKSKDTEARILTHYLMRAYDELRALVGMDTEYKLVIYHFPRGNPNGWGGTSDCTIWYSFDNLDFESQEEWTKHGIPHVSGYVEEMSHNFAPLVTFGWEMVGWHVSRVIMEKLAGNPIFAEQIASTRRTQVETFGQYRSLHNTFPADIPGNVSDRIHAYLLFECERNYGPDFWKDFHAEIRSAYPRLREAECSTTDRDERRNKLYQITLECLSKLDAKHRLLDDTRGFTEMLREYGISLTRDLKSLHPTDESWNRKLE